MKIAIIGGGAAGMMAAAAAKETNPSAEVFLIEKNATLGQKVIISGGGRCNVTTGFSDLRLILDRYPRGGKFLTSAMHAFPPSQVYDWFESHGVPLKTEADLRVFPESNNGRDIVAVFEKLFKQNHTELLFRHDVQKIEPGFTLHFKNHPPLTADKVILTTGGQAYRHTGSTGDGYTFAEGLGHSITPLAPSLNSFITQETWPKELAGVSLPKVALRVKTSKKIEFTGPILFTHRGLTGPAVFALSSLIAFEEYNPEHPLMLTLDLIPFTNQALFETELRKELDANPKKMFKNSLHAWMPKSLASTLCTLLQIDGDKANNEIAKKDFHKAVERIKNLPLTLVGRGAGDEFVTAGGVELSELNPRTLESKITPGLYFAGEILNIDGFTGGYNLQAAWATGRLAGSHAALTSSQLPRRGDER